jgi:hypothetical protein
MLNRRNLLSFGLAIIPGASLIKVSGAKPVIHIPDNLHYPVKRLAADLQKAILESDAASLKPVSEWTGGGIFRDPCLHRCCKLGYYGWYGDETMPYKRRGFAFEADLCMYNLLDISMNEVFAIQNMALMIMAARVFPQATMKNDHLVFPK